MMPLVAIVGRPNVGKSRLFNRLIGARRAIVDDFPGVTRDRNYGETEWYGTRFNLVDTGGFDPGAEDVLLSAMREQAKMAIDEADVVIMLFDGREGLTAADWEINELLRRSQKPVFYAVNKMDSPKQDPLVLEFHELGVERLFPISAEHGHGVDDLVDACAECFAPTDDEDDQPIPENETHIAVVGRPNVGKSTLINKLLGSERLLTSEIPGTTRDSIDTVLEKDGHHFVLIDTAGVRRRRSIWRTLEKFSVVKSFKSIDRAQVVIFLLDGKEGPTDQDARLLRMVVDKGRALLLLVNKWDIVEKDERTAGQYAKALHENLPFCSFAPIEFVSALTGQRVHRVLDRALVAREKWSTRVSTADVNRFLERAVARKQPPVHRNRRVKLYYASQVAASPPTFMFVCNYPRSIPEHYRRYLINQLRQSFDFAGSPIKVFFRPRKKGESVGD